MRFEILHKTHYKYPVPATEAYLELRLTPPTSASQQVHEQSLTISPNTELSTYADYFGNLTHFYSFLSKHSQMLIVNKLLISTSNQLFPSKWINIRVQDIHSIFSKNSIKAFDYLQATIPVPTSRQAGIWAAKYLKPEIGLKDALEVLCEAIHKHFRYIPGSTDNATPLAAVWQQRKGVCQDFAQIMLSILRTGGIPCRYVCGYIESDPPPKSKSSKRLVGSLATHAWVEVLLPDETWVAIDPTNNCWCTEQHITVSVGRDFRDAAPIRGTFKAAGKQAMKVNVRVKRL